jgi:two-component system phosphate regulon sensor histidine kinase PhoR
MQLTPWLAEFWRYALLIGISLTIGLLAGSLAAGLALGSTLYLVWNLYNLYRLERWLGKGRKLEPPSAPGVWGEIYRHLYLLQRRNRSRKRKLKNYLKRFRESTAVTPDAMVVLGGQGEILWWNVAAEELFGLHSPEDVGGSLVERIGNDELREYWQRGRYDRAVEFNAPDDQRLRLSLRVVPFGKNQQLVVGRDVTSFHQLEQMRRDFVANVSHELRTPLTVVYGFVETMIDSRDPGLDRWQRSLELMARQAERMEQVVEDLLLLSRIESGERLASTEEVSLAALTAEIVRAATALSGNRRHRIDSSVEPGLSISGNRRELHSALSNLVFNAVQYTPPGGEITLRCWGDDHATHVEVVDTGEGIAAHHIPRLTERFYRVDVGRSRERGGTGLGLAIVKHVLNRHNGWLEIRSVVGSGSTFICHFDSRNSDGDTVEDAQ